jgi:hypothetical protein
MKRYAILVHSFRNHTKDFEDDVIGIWASIMASATPFCF